MTDFAKITDEEAKLPRFYVEALGMENATYWIRDRLWPSLDVGNQNLISSRSRETADSVCKVLNEHLKPMKPGLYKVTAL